MEEWKSGRVEEGWSSTHDMQGCRRILHEAHSKHVTIDQLAKCDERFAGLDKKTGRGLTLSAKGDTILMGRIELEDRWCQEQKFRQLVGRQILDSSGLVR